MRSPGKASQITLSINPVKRLPDFAQDSSRVTASNNVVDDILDNTKKLAAAAIPPPEVMLKSGRKLLLSINSSSSLSKIFSVTLLKDGRPIADRGGTSGGVSAFRIQVTVANF